MKTRFVAITTPLIPEAKTAAELLGYVARVSNPSNQANMDTVPKLLAYMVRNAHWSPFEMVHLVAEVHTTRTIARQILRHRSFSFQEFSQRYAAQLAPPVFSKARLQDAKNRQASVQTDDSDLQLWWHETQELVSSLVQDRYTQALGRGMAKEVARDILPEGMTESTLYMAGSLRSWIHYLLLRRGNGTQLEHQQIAESLSPQLLKHFPDLVEVFKQ